MAQINEDLETLKTVRDNMKTALENKGQIVNKDIRTYASAITNIPSGSGSGDVKLFDTVEHMQADPNPSEGDLAVVFREETQPVSEDTKFSSCTFPNEVVLDEAFTDYASGYFIGTGDDNYFDGTVYITSSEFRFDGWSDGYVTRVIYTSSDGITYTRIDGGEELQELGATVKWEDWGDPWNDVFGSFMRIGGNYFDGLYEYKSDYVNENKRLLLAMSNITVNFTNNTVVYSQQGNPIFVDSDSVLKLVTKVALDNDITYKGCGLFLDTNDRLHLIPWTTGAESNNIVIYSSDETKQYFGFFVTNYTETDVIYTDYILDVENQTYTSSSVTFTTANYGINNYRYYSSALLKTYPVRLYISNATVGAKWNYTTILIDPFKLSNNITVGANVSGIEWEEVCLKENIYILVNTQLDAIKDYVYGKTFYGKSGVEKGTLGNPEINTREKALLEVDLYNELSELDLGNMGSNLSGLFMGQQSLRYIPIITNTASVTDMCDMFETCTNLTTISNFDTSNVTNMYSMFYMCNKLQAVPNFNTYNVTNMAYMFYSCANLNTVPEFNTYNVTNMVGMFSGCSNLLNVSVMNMSSVKIMYNIFDNCGNLSAQSISNIANSVPPTSQVDIRLICNSGITSDRFTNEDKSVLFSKGYLDCDMNIGNSTQYNIYNGKAWGIYNRGADNDRFGITLHNVLERNVVSNISTNNIIVNPVGDDTKLLLSTANLFSNFYYTIRYVTLNLDTSYVTTTYQMFANSRALETVSNFNTANVINMTQMFHNCDNLKTVPAYNTVNVLSLSRMCERCNNLSNASVHNIINMCLNSSMISASVKNLRTTNYFSPFYNTKFNSSYYSNRLTELTQAGWSY